MWKWGNLLLAFLAELVALGIFAWWGWEAVASTPPKLLLAIGLPVVAAVLWGLSSAWRVPRCGASGTRCSP